MKWEKKGLVFVPDGKYEWSMSHAQVPVVDIVDERIWRIYYATRNSKNQSNISYIEVEAGDPEVIKYVHHEPILPLGNIGTFDDSGIMPSCILTKGDKKYMFYIGWNAATTVGYRLAIGVAISTDNGKSFVKYSEGPILDRSVYDNCLCASPFVYIEDDLWRMWYVSGTHWELINGRPEPFYHIKYASSSDGLNWERKGIVCIDYDDFTEGISRPCIVKKGNDYIMFYSFRNNKDYRTDLLNSYRIGYAFSQDGISWIRKDQDVGIALAGKGWDSEMVAYPYVIEFRDRYYMFYNGNGFGKTGFGYAVASTLL